MSDTIPSAASAPVSEPTGRGSPWRPWLFALSQCFLLLSVLGWLLARLIWLYYFFGLFFFLVAGLLVGAIAFRTARAARPLTKSRLLSGICIVAVSAGIIMVCWEYRHFVETVGSPPRFAQARNAAVSRGDPPRRVQEWASEEFRRALSQNFPPGGPVGYVCWSIAGRELRLTIPGQTDRVISSHFGFVWILRTAAAVMLLAAGLWFSLESLRKPLPVSNVLQPGEEYEEAD